LFDTIVVIFCLFITNHSVLYCNIFRKEACMFYDASSRFRAADSSEDPFSSRQDESSEGVSHNFVVEGLLQGTRDLSITPRDNQEILEALRKADRKGRDVVVGLSNACCKWGCSKSEISSFAERPPHPSCEREDTGRRICVQHTFIHPHFCFTLYKSIKCLQ
uniref:Insulin-like domain-containing protein n=1 Tax=Labrus bergylta TaxID=56723 RepID=A0A3Q3FBC1_9LABR